MLYLNKARGEQKGKIIASLGKMNEKGVEAQVKLWMNVMLVR